MSRWPKIKKSFVRSAGWNFMIENVSALQDCCHLCFTYQYASQRPSMQKLGKWEFSNMLVVFWLVAH
eukprot:12346313-Karenia_brevis.AAC.1